MQSCMHSEFKSSLKHDEVEAVKVENKMEERKKMIAIILIGDVICPN